MTRGIGQIGLVGTLRVGNVPRLVSLRADMDDLPIIEVNTFEHYSRHPVVMRACGHGVHTAMPCTPPCRGRRPLSRRNP